MKILFPIWKYFHRTIADVNQVDHHLNPLLAAHHIPAQGPESLLFVVASFNVPSEGIKQQGDILHPTAPGTVEWWLFLPGTKDL